MPALPRREPRVTELVAFLRAQWDAEEEMARACYSLDWAANFDDPARPFVYDPDQGDSAILDVVIPADAVHVAYWDGRRVLAEVAAKRRILDHVEREIANETPDSLDRLIVDELLMVVMTLAAPCRGRDGWREEWAVT
jgi:hypothetical protein